MDSNYRHCESVCGNTSFIKPRVAPEQPEPYWFGLVNLFRGLLGYAKCS
jgi:hypothetical protein